MKDGMVTNEGGTKRWYLNGKLHRDDGPAVELLGGSKVWYKNGSLHRENGPAIEVSVGGAEYWWIDGKSSVPPDIFDRSSEVCQKCEFFVNTEKGWKWRKKYGVSVKRYKIESREECKNCPRVLEHTVMA
jgi:hypothetical protein